MQAARRLAAQTRRRARQRREQLGAQLAAELGHVSDRMAQIAAHPNLRHGEVGLGEQRIVHLATHQQLRQDVAQRLAHPQLALALPGPAWPPLTTHPILSFTARAAAASWHARGRGNRRFTHSVRATCSTS